MSFSSLTQTPQQMYAEQLKSRNLSDETIKAMQLKLLSPEESAKCLGFRCDWSIEMPYFNIQNERSTFNRVRVLNPSPGMPRYLQARGSGAHIYFPPTVDWSKFKYDVSRPLIITEGEFKAMTIYEALNAESLAGVGVVGLAGVTSWNQKDSGLPLHPDLMALKLSAKADFGMVGRDVFILFDYDGKEFDGEPNPQVKLAEHKLALALTKLGANVKLCRIGSFAVPGRKYAIDDHIAAGKKLIEVLNSSIQLSVSDALEFKLIDFGTKYGFMDGDVLELKSGKVLPYHKMGTQLANNIFQLPAPTAQNPLKTKEIKVLDRYRDWPRRTNIGKIGMFPKYQGLSVTPDGNYNTFKDWKYTPFSGDITKYLDFCKYFFKDDPSFEDYWHDWVATVIQTPWRRNFTTPQFVSALEGIGKSFMAELVADLIGVGDGEGATVVGPDQLFSNYNGFMTGKVLVVVNEPSSDRADHSAKLKNFITAPMIGINNKYGVQYDVDNYLNFIFTSNKPFITTMSGFARREAIYSPKTLDRDLVRSMVEELLDWLRKDKGYQKVMHFYANRDLSSFKPEAPAPMTDAKLEAIALSQSDVQIFAKNLWAWVEKELDGVAFLTANQRKIIWEIWFPGERMPSAQYINRALSALCQVCDGLVKEHGKVIRGFWVTNKGSIIDAIAGKADIARKSTQEVMKLVEDENNGY